MNKDEKTKFREKLAEQFINVLDGKQGEWIKGWNAPSVNSPCNGVTEYQYNGINQFVLGLTAMANGYDDPRWATMVQIIDKDEKYHKGEKWHLKAGSKGTQVEYWFPYDKVNKIGMTWTELKTELSNGREQNEFMIRPKYFYVFNASQIEGIKPYESSSTKNNIEVDELIEKLSFSMNVPVHYDGGGSAYYSQKEDTIHLPLPSYFLSDSEFNGTVLHEFAHSTGHQCRLNRKLDNWFGSESYAFEELVAEMTSCFMASNLSNVDLTAFNDFENNKAYIQNWIKVIKEKPDALIRAIKLAQEATDYMEYKSGIITEHEYEEARFTVVHKIDTKHETKVTYTTAAQLAKEIVDFAKEFDPYEFQHQEQYQGFTFSITYDDLKVGKFDAYCTYFRNIIDDKPSIDISQKANKILKEIDIFKDKESQKVAQSFKFKA